MIAAHVIVVKQRH